MTALDAVAVASRLGYIRRNGLPNPDAVRRLYRDGRFPPPIDPDLHPRMWRWSPNTIDRYLKGEA